MMLYVVIYQNRVPCNIPAMITNDDDLLSEQDAPRV